MAWRVIEQGDRRWQVSPAAEQQPSSRQWSLVFCFRTVGRRALWIAVPMVFTSKVAIYIHADRMTDEALLDLLTQATANERPGGRSGERSA